MESRRVLIELYAGIILYTLAGLVLGIILGIIYGGWAWLFIPGLLVGSFTACYQAYHIYRSLDIALDDADGKKANTYMTGQSLLRLLISAGVLIVAIIIRWQAFVGVAFGLLALKISGYINPFVRKLMGHNEERKDLNSLLMENSEESIAGQADEDEADEDEFDYTFKPIGMKKYKG
ncbi:MAG: ATP synthase subunit I [Lachnospiraceae bacterium]|nr:ATP synthase subunit I [Lachnospiraceae bacterium]